MHGAVHKNAQLSTTVAESCCCCPRNVKHCHPHTCGARRYFLSWVILWINASDEMLIVELGVQLTAALAGTLSSDALSPSDLATFWAILQHILRKYEMIDVPLHVLFSQMESWLGRKITSPTVSIAEKQVALRQCSLGVLSMYSTMKLQRTTWDMRSDRSGGSLAARDEYSIQADPPKYLQSLFTLLDESIDALGGSALILSLWGADNWNLLKQDLVGRVGLAPV